MRTCCHIWEIEPPSKLIVGFVVFPKVVLFREVITDVCQTKSILRRRRPLETLAQKTHHQGLESSLLCLFARHRLAEKKGLFHRRRYSPASRRGQDKRLLYRIDITSHICCHNDCVFKTHITHHGILRHFCKRKRLS